MTVQLTYPGVYVEPVITPAPGNAGVATSVTAFVGRTRMGPVNEPVLVNSFGEFEQRFGGLDLDSTISYSVQQFFDNGGGQALIVRCFAPDISGPKVIQSLVALSQDLVAKAPKTKTKPSVDAYLNSRADAAMGVDQWYLRQVITAFDTAMTPPAATEDSKPADDKKDGKDDKASPKADPPAPPSPGDALQLAATQSVPALPAFTGQLSLNAGNSAYAVIRAVDSAIRVQAKLAPNNRGSVIFAARSITSSYSGGVSHDIADELIGAMAQAPVPSFSNSAAPLAASAAYAAAGVSLTTHVVTPTQQSLNALPESKRDATWTDFTNALTAFANSTGGAAAVLAAGYKALTDAAADANAQSLPAPAALASAMKTAAGTNPAGGVIAQAAQMAAGVPGASVEDVMSASCLAAIEDLQEAWQPLVDLQLQAADPGAWSNDVLQAVVDHRGITAQVAQTKQLDQKDLFNLTITYVRPDGSVQSEQHSCVTLKTTDKTGAKTPANVALVLERGSMLVRLLQGADLPEAPPMEGASGVAAGGEDSEPLSVEDYIGDEAGKAGVYALQKTHSFNILCIPPDDADGDTDNMVYATAASYCVSRNAMLIVDPPASWSQEIEGGNLSSISLEALGSFGAPEARSSVVYFPRVKIYDTLMNGAVRVFPPSGTMAGQWAQADRSVGVWKAAAGLDAVINAVSGLEHDLSDSDDGALNPVGINCLRTFPIGGSVIWGARTMRGATALADEYRYVPVRRLLLYIMDWLELNTRWAVFEPNDEQLWSSLRLQIGEFMKKLYKNGALVGASPDKAFFVRCDATTTTSADQDNGVVNVEVGFAPVKPAEFVVVRVQQIHQSAG